MQRRGWREFKRMEEVYMYYIGVDLGTSAVKLLLMEGTGEIRKIVSREYPLYFPQPGWSETFVRFHFLYIPIYPQAALVKLGILNLLFLDLLAPL